MTGKPKHDVERCLRAGPVRFDEIGAAPPEDVPQCEGDDDGVVEVAGDGNEVGDEVERHEQIRDQDHKDELLTAGDPGIREQSLEEDDAVGNERRRGSRPLSTTGHDENRDEDGVKSGRCHGGHENCLPESQPEGERSELVAWRPSPTLTCSCPRAAAGGQIDHATDRDSSFAR